MLAVVHLQTHALVWLGKLISIIQVVNPIRILVLPTCLGVYRTERYGNFSYNIPVSNGSKYVILKFAEIYFNTVGARIFNVNINGVRVISNLDIFKEVGFAKPLDLSFPVSVTNNNINIEFIPVVQNPKVSGIEVLSQ